MTTADRIAARFPQGLFIAATKALLTRLKHLSLARAIALRISSPHGQFEQKVPAWIGDAYVCLTALFAFTIVAIDPSNWGLWPRRLVTLILTYRALELLVFLLCWLLVDSGPLHSYRRSVIAFGVNVLEMALVATALDQTLGCSATGGFAAFWTHLTGMVGLDGSGLADRSGACRLVLEGRFLFSGVILLLVVGTVAGGLMREEVKH